MSSHARRSLSALIFRAGEVKLKQQTTITSNSNVVVAKYHYPIFMSLASLCTHRKDLQERVVNPETKHVELSKTAARVEELTKNFIKKYCASASQEDIADMISSITSDLFDVTTGKHGLGKDFDEEGNLVAFNDESLASSSGDGSRPHPPPLPGVDCANGGVALAFILGHIHAETPLTGQHGVSAPKHTRGGGGQQQQDDNTTISSSSRSNGVKISTGWEQLAGRFGQSLLWDGGVMNSGENSMGGNRWKFRAISQLSGLFLQRLKAYSRAPDGSLVGKSLMLLEYVDRNWLQEDSPRRKSFIGQPVAYQVRWLLEALRLLASVSHRNPLRSKLVGNIQTELRSRLLVVVASTADDNDNNKSSSSSSSSPLSTEATNQVILKYQDAVQVAITLKRLGIYDEALAAIIVRSLMSGVKGEFKLSKSEDRSLLQYLAHFPRLLNDTDIVHKVIMNALRPGRAWTLGDYAAMQWLATVWSALHTSLEKDPALRDDLMKRPPGKDPRKAATNLHFLLERLCILTMRSIRLSAASNDIPLGLSKKSEQSDTLIARQNHHQSQHGSLSKDIHDKYSSYSDNRKFFMQTDLIKKLLNHVVLPPHRQFIRTNYRQANKKIERGDTDLVLLDDANPGMIMPCLLQMLIRACPLNLPNPYPGTWIGNAIQQMHRFYEGRVFGPYRFLRSLLLYIYFPTKPIPRFRPEAKEQRGDKSPVSIEQLSGLQFNAKSVLKHMDPSTLTAKETVHLMAYVRNLVALTRQFGVDYEKPSTPLSLKQEQKTVSANSKTTVREEEKRESSSSKKSITPADGKIRFSNATDRWVGAIGFWLSQLVVPVCYKREGLTSSSSRSSSGSDARANDDDNQGTDGSGDGPRSKVLLLYRRQEFLHWIVDVYLQQAIRLNSDHNKPDVIHFQSFKELTYAFLAIRELLPGPLYQYRFYRHFTSLQPSDWELLGENLQRAVANKLTDDQVFDILLKKRNHQHQNSSGSSNNGSGNSNNGGDPRGANSRNNNTSTTTHGGSGASGGGGGGGGGVTVASSGTLHFRSKESRETFYTCPQLMVDESRRRKEYLAHLKAKTLHEFEQGQQQQKQRRGKSEEIQQHDGQQQQGVPSSSSASSVHQQQDQLSEDQQLLEWLKLKEEEDLLNL